MSIQHIISTFLGFFNGVPLFFFLSGFLILRSVLKNDNSKQFAYKRIMRLYPELWVAVVIEIITIVVLYYDKIQWGKLALFSVTQATIFQFWTPSFLRGFGCGTPNGSLWTIVVFVQFYFLIWIFRGLIKKLSFKHWIWIEIAFVLIGLASSWIDNYFPEIVVKLYRETIIPYLWIFFMGMIVSRYWEKIVSHITKWWFLFIVLYIIYCFVGIDLKVGDYPIVKAIITSLGCLGIAFKFPKINIKIDISYEIYIMHMIVVNTLIEMGFIGLKGMIVAIIITVGVSICLYYVNKRFLIKTNKTTSIE